MWLRLKRGCGEVSRQPVRPLPTMMTDASSEEAPAAASATGVSLYFSQGPQLPDPRRLLRGSGKQVRFIQVEAASQLAHPDVEALIVATIDQARVPLPSEGKGSLIIKSDGEKKPPRRKPSE